MRKVSPPDTGITHELQCQLQWGYGAVGEHGERYWVVLLEEPATHFALNSDLKWQSHFKSQWDFFKHYIVTFFQKSMQI